MRRAVWINAWDVEERDPSSLIDELRSIGLNGANLGLSYHGGRLLLGNHPRRVVYEKHRGAVYFPAGLERFPARLQPEVAGDTGRFLGECDRQGFDLRAWLVLCHNDALGRSAEELCVRNAFGEVYGYALCPAQEEVQEYCVELCRQASSLPGVRGLDLEALSFLGYPHQGLHEKCGVTLPPACAWWLSICCCAVCEAALPGVSASLRDRLRLWLQDPYAPPAPLEDRDITAWRSKVQKRLLARIREACPGVVLNLRSSGDPHFAGGKSTIPLDELAGLAHEATFSFFGARIADMQRQLDNLPHPRPLPVHGGMVFHEPDCHTPDDVITRLNLLHRAGMDAFLFYGYSMAARPHWLWLRDALKGLC